MDDTRPNMPAASVRLFDPQRGHLRNGGYAEETGKTCLRWVRRLVLCPRV